MPSETFFNLPEDKRQRFIDAAVDEFSSRPYDQASITRIVKRLGIAKGSVYQYFDGKLDLFTWLVHQAGARRTSRFVSTGDPLNDMAAAWADGLEQWKAEPKWNRLLIRLLEPTTEPGLQQLARETRTLAHAHTVGWLKEAEQQGRLRSGVDIHTSAWFVLGVMQQGLLDAFFDRADTDLDRFAADAPALEDEIFAHALGVAQDAIEFLRMALFVSGNTD